MKQDNQNEPETTSPLLGTPESWNPARFADLSISQLLGELLSVIAQRERTSYLEDQRQDKANGFYSRQLGIGSLPLNVIVPRVRSGEFRPAILPDKHLRGYPQEQQELLLNILISSRSKAAVKEAIQRLGLPFSQTQMDQIASDVVEEFTLKHTQPLDSDLLAIWMDGKVIDVRDGNCLKPHLVYLAVGLGVDGKKRIISYLIEEGRESLEGWKKLLRNLLDRGLRRVWMLVHDDFSGLSKLTQSLFPTSHV
jgi:transposase-like protein